MGQIRTSPDISDLKDDKEKFRYIQLFLQSTQNVVNGGLELTKNVRQKILEIDFPTINVNVSVKHDLGYIPTGYIVIRLSNNMVISDGTIKPTDTTWTLQSDNEGTAKVMFF